MASLPTAEAAIIGPSPTPDPLSSVSPAAILLLLYVLSEILFLLYYHLFLLPRANRPAVPEPYRDYGDERHMLMLRILDRTERTCEMTGARGGNVRAAVAEFLAGWFYSEVEGMGVAELLERDAAERDGRGEGAASGKGGTAQAERTPSMASATSDSSTSSSSSSEADRSGKATENREGADLGEGIAGSSSSSPSSSSSDVRFPRRSDMDSFFSWAFFAKSHSALKPYELSELDRVYSILLERHGITFEPGSTPGIKPMNLTLDDVRPTYRPMGVYAFFVGLYMVGSAALLAAGFQRYTAGATGVGAGLTYWHRPGRVGACRSSRGASAAPALPAPTLLPLVFFHGIAPGGLALYLPLLLFGLCRDRSRPAFFFENVPISFVPRMEAVSEEDTARGVEEALGRHLDGDVGDREENAGERGIAVVGHSFGTFQVTWMLRHPPVRRRIRQVVIMDPVSVMLSEPDVITNFVYGRHQVPNVSVWTAVRPILLFPAFYVLSLLTSSRAASFLGKFCSERSELAKSTSTLLRTLSSLSSPPEFPTVPRGRYNKIWMVQSEIFIEHYLRRKFCWYNSELFLDRAIPSNVRTVVCLAGRDEILSVAKVRREVERWRRMGEVDGRRKKNEDDSPAVIYWKEGGHAYCVPRPSAWVEIRRAMDAQEGTIWKEVQAAEARKKQN